MKVIIGTYRGPEMVSRAVDSLNEHLRGSWDSWTIVDDSDRGDWADAYRQMALESPIPGKVLTLPGLGYNAAMKAVCADAGHSRFLFWEEDFVLTREVHLDQLEELLDARPELAQITLQRQPWFPIERAAGGMMEGLVARLGLQQIDLQKIGFRFTDRPDWVWEPWLAELPLWSQVGTFSCNPSVWNVGVAAAGWPDGAHSEDRFRDVLRAQGYRFGITEEVYTNHDGIRSGHGY